MNFSLAGSFGTQQTFIKTRLRAHFQQLLDSTTRQELKALVVHAGKLKSSYVGYHTNINIPLRDPRPSLHTHTHGTTRFSPLAHESASSTRVNTPWWADVRRGEEVVADLLRPLPARSPTRPKFMGSTGSGRPTTPEHKGEDLSQPYARTGSIERILELAQGETH